MRGGGGGGGSEREGVGRRGGVRGPLLYTHTIFQSHTHYIYMQVWMTPTPCYIPATEATHDFSFLSPSWNYTHSGIFQFRYVCEKEHIAVVTTHSNITGSPPSLNGQTATCLKRHVQMYVYVMETGYSPSIA